MRWSLNPTLGETTTKSRITLPRATVDLVTSEVMSLIEVTYPARHR